MDDVARRAGVGVGTVYRHFPTKEALVEAVAAAGYEEICTIGREALDQEDPWQAFSDFMWRGARGPPHDPAPGGGKTKPPPRGPPGAGGESGPPRPGAAAEGGGAGGRGGGGGPAPGH